jgi:hypothetical protein
MSTATKVEELRETLTNESEIQAGDLRRLNYRLSDAIREGSLITVQANGWGDGEQACAMHAAVIAARARGHME